MEEAFYTTDRVMTVSFHKYGEFFPGTGELRVRYFLIFNQINPDCMSRMLVLAKESGTPSIFHCAMVFQMRTTNPFSNLYGNLPQNLEFRSHT